MVAYSKFTPVSGSCRVTVQLAGPWSDALTQINIIPNSIRVAAGGVLDECVEDDPNHLGGYVTNNFRQLRNYVSSPLTNLTGEWRNKIYTLRIPWLFILIIYRLARYLDPPLIFFTVTIDGGDGPLNSPGDYDEMPPKMLARNLGDKQREAKGTPLEQHYRDGVRQYLGYAVQARVSGYTNRWWSPAQNSIAADNMAYECDADLGTPNSTECSQIEYSQLGAAGDKITIGPGNPKVLSSSKEHICTKNTCRFLSGAEFGIGTCNVAITSAMLIVITWAQVKAALDELIDLCGSNPQQGAVGGKAYYGTTVTPSLGIMGRQVSGEFLRGESLVCVQVYFSFGVFLMTCDTVF